MTPSPPSAISSDLYSLAQPAQAQAHFNRGQDSPLEREHSRSLPESLQIEPEEWQSFHISQNVALVPDGDPRSSSVLTAAEPNGVADLYPKRKRDNGSGDRGSPQQDPLGVNSQRELVNQKNIHGLALAQEREQSGTPADFQLSNKRSKVEGHDPDPAKGASSSTKSFVLPAVLWQHIFCFVPPVFLGRLLRVDHAFNKFLAPGQMDEESGPPVNSIVRPLHAEAIWVASRRRFCPGLPRPMRGMLELDMWRLLRGRDCQVCRNVKAAISAHNPDIPWESGPGESGVRVVWPFGIRCCGQCLQDVTKKEIDLSLSGDFFFFLLQALPFAFVSEANHFIGHSLVRNHTVPPTLRLTKHYYKTHLEDIKQQLERAKKLGTASAEEWAKGLAKQGQERLDDTLRWEQWEAKGGLKKVNSRPQPKPAVSGPANADSKSAVIKSKADIGTSSPQNGAILTRLENNYGNLVSSVPLDRTYFGQSVIAPVQQPWSSGLIYPGSVNLGLQTPFYQPRPERNLRDVNEAKAARRAEIERRCSALDPAISASVLNHMDTFQAAIQISQPMTDQAWEVLKPRLLSQWQYAERREKEYTQQAEMLREEHSQRRQQEAQMKEAKENIDREWETFQVPVRSCIGAIADEIIETKWAKGKKITKENSPKFAADVLCSVRERFYAGIAEEDEAAIAAGEPIRTDLPDSPPTRNLILENMKWVFDNKIKPLTDRFQRELFLCNDCDGNFKCYGFEGVIQHFAAKHTTTLSMGNIVVHWRAEWPEHPPFHPAPSVAKTTYYRVPTPATPSVPDSSIRGSQESVHNEHHIRVEDNGIPTAFEQPQKSQARIETHEAQHTDLHQEGSAETLTVQPHPPGMSAKLQQSGAAYPEAQSGHLREANQVYHYPSVQYCQTSQVYDSSIHPYHSYTTWAQGQPSLVTQSIHPTPNTGINMGYRPVPAATQYSSGLFGTYPPRPDFGTAVPGQVSDLYQRQMGEMAKHAKEVFSGIGGIRDLPGSVRIFVTIQHTVSRFKETFPNEPSLAMFIDGLDHNATMRPVRSINGLACKTCVSTGILANTAHQPHGIVIGDRRLYTLPHLVNHFKTTHAQITQAQAHPQSGAQNPEFDWKTDMVELPDLPVISNLINAFGMTDSKLSLIAATFPNAFPSPLPKLRTGGNVGPVPVYRAGLDTNTRGQQSGVAASVTDLSSSLRDQSNEHPFIRPYSGSGPPSQAPPSEPPGEDEYDPHRPAYLGKIVKIESRSKQSSKAGRPSALQNGHQSQNTRNSLLNQREPERSVQRAGSSQSADLGQPFNQVENDNTALSNGSHITSRSDDVSQRALSQLNPSRHERLNENELFMDPAKRHEFLPGDRGTDKEHLIMRERVLGTSPPRRNGAADRFLGDIASSPGASQARWLGETPVNRRPTYFGEEDSRDRGYDGGADNKSAQYNSHNQTDHVEVGSANHAVSSQRPVSRPQYPENFRSKSHIQIPLLPARDGDYSPGVYNPYRESQQTVVHERQEVNGTMLKRARGGSHSYQAMRTSRYRGRSRSPQRVSPETALYRTRSPVEEDRGPPVYHVSSSSSRKESRPERVVSYDFPMQHRYEYVDERELKPQYQQRFEYVPVRYQDSGPVESARYVIAQPIERMAEPEYIRYEREYPGEPVYERNGQVFEANQRAYGEQGSRASPYGQEYRYQS